ncbi:MAG: glycosyltransferase family 39 protein [Chloroflexi bacterium]|nr:glycosyltransferase family 39 protein [Chloroflexota bacterium]
MRERRRVVNRDGDTGSAREQVEGRQLGRLEDYFVPVLLVIAAVSHAYNMFNYPEYLGDEGIYLEQAWAVIRQAKLSPYTYFYDHAPAGWLVLAGWIALLPRQFTTFGMAINSGRVFMLLVHVASVYLLYHVTRRLSRSTTAAFLTCLIFTLSPLGLFYQRMILLDNIMVFWLLLSLYWLVRHGERLMALLGSGLAFGLALLTKENAVFFLPVLFYILYQEVKDSYRFRFALSGWIFTWSIVVSIYPLYAFLKSELFPEGISLVLTNEPGSHVSLISTFIWQLSRRGGSIMDPSSEFWFFFWGRWWPKDAAILLLGASATLLNLAIGLSDLQGKRGRGFFVTSLLCLSFALYLMRGSVILAFYVVPVVPFAAMNMGMLADRVIRVLPGTVARWTFVLVAIVLTGVYLFLARDHYTLNQTQLQARQLQFIRSNVPSSAFLIIDDDLWVDLHERSGRSPVYPKAHSHWKVQGDPDIREKMLGDDWRNADYLVLSTGLADIFNGALSAEREDFVLAAHNNSRTIAVFEQGNVRLEVRKINK